MVADCIDKEDIAILHFPPTEVLHSQEEIRQRKVDAERARFLGNCYTSKVLIQFKDATGIKQVETTIWAVTETKVILKNNMSIPLARIIKVHIPDESLKYPNI
jgi:hypothetical protein